MKLRLAFHSVLVILFLPLCPAALASNTWYVDGVHGNDNNDCKTRQHACKTIRHAIALASSGDSVMVAAATYTENLTIRFSLTITGASASTTIVDGGGKGTVVTISSTGAHVSLSEVSIQNGLTLPNAVGGGINNSGRLTINNSAVNGNHASTGGGIYNNGTLKISNSVLSSNHAGFCTVSCGEGYGGGIWNDGSLTINNSTLSGNLGDLGGGGIYNYYLATLTINNSTLSENEAFHHVCTLHCYYVGDGGGIWNGGGGSLTINDSTLTGNRAQDEYGGGGAIWNGSGGSLTINNSTLAGNYASGNYQGSGGGIYSDGYRLTINNSTLSGNYALRGGGIAGSATLQNSIVANSSSGGNCYGTMTSNGYNLSSDTSCNFNNTGDMNNTDPNLGTLGKYGGPTQTIPLLEGSPAIDAGNPNGCTDGKGHLLKTDQRGKPRPDHEDSGGCDMGAYERQRD